MATLSAGWTMPVAAPAAATVGPGVVDPTASGTARLVMPFALAVVVVVLVAGLAFGTAVRQDDPNRSARWVSQGVPTTA